MGMLSKIKKAAKGVWKGVKKGFKSALGKFAKVLNNKYVKIALMVVSLVVPVLGMATAGWAQAAAQGAGMMGKIGGALSNVARGVASMVVNAVTTPVKAVLNAGAKGATMLNANGLAATLSNGAKMVGGASGSLFGTVKTDSLSQIVQRWSGAGDAAATGVKATGVVADTAAGLGTNAASGATEAVGNSSQFGDLANKVTADGSLSSAGQAASGTSQAAGKFGDLATKVTADGTLTKAGQAAAGTEAAGGVLQTAGGLMKKTAGLIKENPEVAKMAFSTLSSAMTPSESELLEKEYKLQNKWRQEQNQAWDRFDPNANQVASQSAQQYGQAAEQQQKPYDWRRRAEEARQQFSQPLLKRYAGGY